MSRPILKYWIILVLFTWCNGKSLLSIEKIYLKGVQAYTGERWSECISKFEESLHLYKLYNSIFINCGVKCKTQARHSQIEPNFNELQVFESYLNERYCLMNCRDKELEAVRINSNVKDTILQDFQSRKPYGYLHVCYFQMNALQKAASAAYTYFQAHKTDDVMKNNVKFYIGLPEVSLNEVVDLESEDFEVLHKVGLESYEQKKWGETIMAMEEVIADYLAWEMGCRVACEHLPEQEWSQEFVISVSNNMLSLLQCRQQCQNKLSTLDFKTGIEFLADTLNYLQICYYHSDKFEEAAVAVASYLTLMPKDEDMLHNRALYGSFIDKNAFNPRPDIEYYLKNDFYEKEILSHFHQTNTIDTNAHSEEL
ncbi:cartilage-associated protein-like [Cydia amplana]|uniref:cartilage-associated protein-like n=1 Tax=Cydia amplana TaxID=1869771 RepID=UPI002FE60050